MKKSCVFTCDSYMNGVSMYLHVFTCMHIHNISIQLAYAFSANPANILCTYLHMHLSKCWAHVCIIKHI